MAAILALTAGLLLWELPENGWGNAYYASAVHAATHSWSAFWTASLDASQTVSVDKTPLSIWMMALSARLFGFSPAALLVPNALCALGSVALLHALVRRAFGAGTGLLAALFLATTPALVAVGRFDNPDALLVLLLLASAYAGLCAVESEQRWHAIACGVLLGLAFNTKMLQAFLVLPGLAALLLASGPRERAARLRLLALIATSLLLVSLAWLVPLSLVPSGARPWFGDTTTNSPWQLVVASGGVGRLGGAGQGLGGVVAAADPLRLVARPTGGQIAWLLPLALTGALIAVRSLKTRSGTRLARGTGALWLGWALVHILAFSLLGLFHPYYTSALAPAVAALAALGAATLWGNRRRSHFVALAGLVVVGSSVMLEFLLLGRYPHFLPWLSPTLAGLAGISAVLGLRLRRARRGWVPGFAAGLLLLCVVLGPLSFAWATTQRQLGGIDPTGGPGSYETKWTSANVAARAKLITWLKEHQGSARYLTAVSGALAGAPIALLSNRPVLTMGGFAGGDPAPSTATIARLVSEGQVRNVVLTGPPPASNGASTADLGGAKVRRDWVRSHCAATYPNLTLPTPSGPVSASVYRC